MTGPLQTNQGSSGVFLVISSGVSRMSVGLNVFGMSWCLNGQISLQCMKVMLLMHWCSALMMLPMTWCCFIRWHCWCTDAAYVAGVLIRLCCWCADDAGVLMLRLYWCCWCAGSESSRGPFYSILLFLIAQLFDRPNPYWHFLLFSL